MTRSANLCKRHRFPPAIIQYAVWLYHRFRLSHRDIEDLLAERGIEVSYESVRLWCNKFGPHFLRRLRRKHPGFGDTFFIDDVFVTIAGQRHYLWRAVDHDGDVVDVHLQARRHAEAAKRLFRRPPPRRVSPPTHFPIVRGSAIDGHGWSAGDARNPFQFMELEVVARAGIEPATRGFSTQRRARFGASKLKKPEVFSRVRPNRPARPSPYRTLEAGPDRATQ